MVPYIYDILLFLMLSFLYLSGKEIAKTGKIRSRAGIVAILVYTLNEGLRYGRGIDYNLYGMAFEQIETGVDPNWDISFQFVANILISMDIPWQGYVILMSFMFILATIMLLRIYKEVLPYALPLFVLFSNSSVENMVRWYLGFSFILIGLSFLINENKATVDGEQVKQETKSDELESFNEDIIKKKWRKAQTKYLLFSVFACTFHLALLPLPIIFYLIYLRKSPLLSPVYALLIYFGVAYSFKTDFMLQFTNLANILTMTLGESSERFAGYGDKTEYWLTGGYADFDQNALPDWQSVLFLCAIVLLGYKAIKDADRKYIYAYNLFIVGLCTSPIANQIELIGRFNAPFMFFRAMVLAYAFEYIYRRKEIEISKALFLLSIIIFLNFGRQLLTAPFIVNQEKFLYIWDSDRRTYQSMYDMWLNDMYNVETKSKRGE